MDTDIIPVHIAVSPSERVLVNGHEGIAEQSGVIIELTSQLPVKDWYAAIGDVTLADAILDRLVHNSHRIVLKGKSMRPIDPTAEWLYTPS